VNTAQQDTSLAPSLRLQIPQAAELILDFRNNRNVAHLGGVDANKLDATCVVQMSSWVMGEIVRLETSLSADEVQRVLDSLAERHVPIIEMVGDLPIVTDTKLSAAERALVLLYHHNDTVPIGLLRTWAEYGNPSRWRTTVLASLLKNKLIHLDGNDVVLLTKGTIQAEAILARQVAAAA
jgi:hypothetical protein